MGMLGLRDLFVIAPASSFNHHYHQSQDPITANDQINGQNAATAVGVGVGVIPLLTAAPCLQDSDNLLNSSSTTTCSKLSGMQLRQNQNTSHNYLKNNNNTSVYLIQTTGGGGGGGGMGGGGSGGGSGSSTGATCQDCGNQAKKDCTHRRCRTCCKSRGFDCTTHVKSTWVPAARRRERQLVTVGAGSSGSTSGAKKPRLVTSQTTTTSHTSTSNTTPPRRFDTSSSHQDAGFKETLPGQVRAPAVFKCVKVTAVEDGEDAYAYQAVVKIGGHVFKGFLYDQGIEGRDGFPDISELHLGGGGSNGGGGGERNGGSSSSPVLDPSEVYAATGGGFLGGTGYGNPIN